MRPPPLLKKQSTGLSCGGDGGGSARGGANRDLSMLTVTTSLPSPKAGPASPSSASSSSTPLSPKTSSLRNAGSSMFSSPKATPADTPRKIPLSGSFPRKPEGPSGGDSGSADISKALGVSSLAHQAMHVLDAGRMSNENAGAGASATTTLATAPSGASGGAVAASASMGDVSPAIVEKFHSAIRWAKPMAEIEAICEGEDYAKVCAAKDPKNGNRALHIAAQNGHTEIVERLLQMGASPNAQNGRGQTPLHMAVEYEFYFVSKLLLDAGADTDLENLEGHKAIVGIDGQRTGPLAWDSAVTVLKAALTSQQIEEAFTKLEQASKDSVDKIELIQAGMAKKKNPETKDIWDHKRFLAVAATF
eukprot:TRINITY_DN37647_c0_g1_i1.p1 TRINITY_DN37647_c0_g1~~TRINITY_DN37647_c0_g1_i1.p1  ORF type:complete len:362 (-),score=66.00 TRINITY_DN37647_c0_g1_i1:173-1258(-)